MKTACRFAAACALAVAVIGIVTDGATAGAGASTPRHHGAGPLAWAWLTLPGVLLMLLPSTVTARPRFIYTAFPMFIAAAVWFERDKRDWWPYVIGACSAGLVGLTALYGVLGAIP